MAKCDYCGMDGAKPQRGILWCADRDACYERQADSDRKAKEDAMAGKAMRMLAESGLESEVLIHRAVDGEPVKFYVSTSLGSSPWCLSVYEAVSAALSPK